MKLKFSHKSNKILKCLILYAVMWKDSSMHFWQSTEKVMKIARKVSGVNSIFCTRWIFQVTINITIRAPITKCFEKGYVPQCEVSIENVMWRLATLTAVKARNINSHHYISLITLSVALFKIMFLTCVIWCIMHIEKY